MDRRRDSRTRIICILGSAFVVALLAAAPALADPIAGDEYALDLNGVREGVNAIKAKAADNGDSSGNRTQSGVVGEGLPTRSVLSSASSLVGGPAVVAIVLGGLTLISFGPRSLRTSRPR